MNLKKLLLSSFFLTFFSLPLLLAQGSISGIVFDETGQPAVGANIIISATTQGASSGTDGSYTIENVAPGEIKLTVSYTGFQDQFKTVTVNSGETTKVNFSLGVDSELLDEVIVIGYGTQRSRDLVGNISKVGSEDLLDQVGGTFETALQGKAPGIQITQGSGTAGSHSIVRIRGTSSVSAGGDPLYVIDGVPVSQDNYLLGETGGQNNNPLSSINPADIASVEILKDAASAAIYGSRAANGVILITTKRGKKGKPSFNFTTRVGLAQPTNVVDVLDSDEWLGVQQEAWENSGNVGRVPLPNSLSYNDIEGINTDWIDEVIRNGMKHEQSLSMRTGNKWLSSYVGLTYSKNESYLINNDFERISGRVNLDITPFKKIKLNISSSTVRGTRNKTPQAWAGGLGWAQSTSLPIYPIYKNEFVSDSPQYDESGGYYNIYNNPVAQVDLQSLQTREWRYLNSAQLTYMPTKSLTLSAQGSYDFTNIGDYTYEQMEWTGSTPISKASIFKIKNKSAYATAQYVVPTGKDHSFSVLVGTDYQDYNRTRLYAEDNRFEGQFFEIDEYKEQIDSLSFFDDEGYKFFSLFTRLSYNYKEKYYAQAVFRRDASSKFGANNRWGNFPSLGVGYIISEEDFWKKGGPVNYMKFKASWGLTGNSNIPWREQFSTYAFNNNPGTVNNGLNYNGDTQYQIKEANPDLKWELVQTIDVGVDFGFFNDKVTAGLTYYHKLTKGALLREFLAASSGFNELQFYRNVGKIRNQGVEFELSTKNQVGKFLWTADFNIAANRNLVLDVGNATPDALDGGFGDTRIIEGEPIGVNYIILFDHVDEETGRPVYLDAEGNETFEYNPATNRAVAGNIQPDFTGGLRNTLKYGKWDLSFLFYFSKGGTIYDDAAKRQLGVIANDWNYTQDVFDRWRQAGDDATLPKYVNSMLEWGGSGNIWQNNHSLWLYDASFIRLRNIALGYDIKPRTKVIRNIRVTLSANNLLTFTKYRGWDPEVARDRSQEQERNVGGTNITYLTPPQEKSYVLGLSFDF